MNPFEYRDGELHAEDVPLSALAGHYGTPTYVYSRAAVLRNLQRFRDAFAFRETDVCYSVKANSNLGLLAVLAGAGASFDVVSAGELQRVVRAGGDPTRVVFSGVGKQDAELRYALELGIACFNVESTAELERLNDVARELGTVAPVSIRVNPDVDPKTHPYIATGLNESKFGIPAAEAREVYRRAATLPGLRVCGIDCHIGSQITSLEPYLDAFTRLMALTDDLARDGIDIRHVDIGGGMGIRYRAETALDIEALAGSIDQLSGNRKFALKLEPGRAIVANAGILLARVVLVKANGTKRFSVVDAAMNDLIRPALYQAWQDIRPVRAATEATDVPMTDVVGPVCESGDFLGKDRRLDLARDDLVAVFGAGAYGFTMSSNYNTRGRAAEVIVDGDRSYLVRRRETIDDLLALEHTMADATSTGHGTC